MKKHLVLLLLLLVPAFSFGQYYKYQSREEDEYNKNYKYKHFEPMTEDQIKHYKNEFFDFEHIANYTPYNDSLFMLPYLDIRILYYTLKTTLGLKTRHDSSVKSTNVSF